MHNDTPITVRELIVFLQTLPPYAEVLYRCCSDWSPLSLDDVELVTAENKSIIYRPQNGYSDFHPSWDYGPGPHDFRTCVLFPGN